RLRVASPCHAQPTAQTSLGPTAATPDSRASVSGRGASTIVHRPPAHRSTQGRKTSFPPAHPPAHSERGRAAATSRNPEAVAAGTGARTVVHDEPSERSTIGTSYAPAPDAFPTAQISLGDT